MLRLAEGAVISAKRVARGEAGSVTLGFTPGSSYAFLPRLAAIASEEMPDIDLVLKEMDIDDQMEALGAGRLDAGAVRLPVDRRGIELACVMREPILLAVCEGHALAERATHQVCVTSNVCRLSCTRQARDATSTTSCPACYVLRKWRQASFSMLAKCILFSRS